MIERTEEDQKKGKNVKKKTSSGNSVRFFLAKSKFEN